MNERPGINSEHEEHEQSRALAPDPVRHVITVPEFLGIATAESLRRKYDEKFADPSAVSGDRFCWDYWHVPGQYTQMRTPAQVRYNQLHIRFF
jgi:hypothetical protein